MTLNIGGKMITNSSTNNSAMDDSMPNFPEYTLVLLLLILPIGIIGNFLLIISHIKDPLKVVKSSSSYFIFNIALVDLLSSNSLILVIFSSNNRSHNVMASLLTSWLYTVSFTLYLSLAIQRFCSVVFPLWHRVKITTRICRYWVTGIWLGSIILYGGMAIMSNTEVKIQTNLTILVLKWLMLLITQSLYIASCISIRKQNRQTQSRNELNAATERTIAIHLKNESNFIVTISIVCFIQGVSTLPFLSMAFIVIFNATTSSQKGYKKIIPSYYIWGVLGIGVNSAINVFIYIWRLPRYRKTFKKFYCDC